MLWGLTVTKYVYRLIPPMLDGYNRYRDATGAILEEDTGLLSIISAKYDNLQSFILVIRVNNTS
jgi:hypothetical protein